MIIRWGRKGLVANAIAFTFVTAISASSINYVQPDYKINVKHVTPISVTAKSIKRFQVRTDNRIEFRHVTPIEVDEHLPGYYGVDGITLKREDNEDDVIALLMAMYESRIL